MIKKCDTIIKKKTLSEYLGVSKEFLNENAFNIFNVLVDFPGKAKNLAK